LERIKNVLCFLLPATTIFHRFRFVFRLWGWGESVCCLFHVPYHSFPATSTAAAAAAAATIKTRQGSGKTGKIILEKEMTKKSDGKSGEWLGFASINEIFNVSAIIAAVAASPWRPINLWKLLLLLHVHVFDPNILRSSKQKQLNKQTGMPRWAEQFIHSATRINCAYYLKIRRSYRWERSPFRVAEVELVDWNYTLELRSSIVRVNKREQIYKVRVIIKLYEICRNPEGTFAYLLRRLAATNRFLTDLAARHSAAVASKCVWQICNQIYFNLKFKFLQINWISLPNELEMKKPHKLFHNISSVSIEIDLYDLQLHFVWIVIWVTLKLLHVLFKFKCIRIPRNGKKQLTMLSI